MRENRLYGSEGGAGVLSLRSYPYRKNHGRSGGFGRTTWGYLWQMCSWEWSVRSGGEVLRSC